MARDPGADRAVRFINNLTHTKGVWAGQPFTLRPWQEKRIIRPLFQTRHDGLRQYRTCLLMLPRKNGKTELAAAIALYGLLGDGEMGAEVYLAANDRDQASLTFGVAMQMIRNDPELEAAVEIVESQKRILQRGTGSFLKVVSSEAYTKHGLNASMVVYDELHAAPNRELYDVLSTSMGARRQPLLIIPTTAGYDRHSILWELYTHAQRVAERPALDPTFLPILYEASIEANWQSPAVWRRANPALGDFRSLEDLKTLAARALAIPAQENVFRRLYLNQWTEQAARWIAMAAWDACLAALERASLRGRRCWVGMDLSATTDLTALCAVFPLEQERVYALPHFFLPAEVLAERERRDRVPYQEWARAGLLTVTPGPVVDYEAVRAQLRAWSTEFHVEGIAYDPWNATDLVTRLEQQDGCTCVAIRQGFASLSAPTKALETAILAKTLGHDGHPILRWNVSNVAVETDAAGNVKPSKAASTARIDGVVALVMALDLVTRQAHTPAPRYQVMIFGPPTTP